MMAAGIISQKLKLFIRAKAADLQRDHPVREAHEGRHDRAEHHDQPVHRGERVEQLGVEILQARLEQLQANAQRQDAADHQHREREQQVQGTDVLVVGGEHPAPPAGGRMVVMVVVVRVAAVVVENSTHEDSLIRLSRPGGYCWRAASTSAGCTTWPVLLPQLFLV
jgi:hypothetical protein